MTSPKRILYVVNIDWFFISHRLPIAQEAIKKGYEVHVATKITNKKIILEREGFCVHSINIKRGHSNFIKELKLIYEFCVLFKKIKPDLVHLVTIKPVIFGGIAARIANIKSVVSAISGLGHVFIDKGLKASIRRKIVINLYKLAFKHRNIKVIIQNNNDKRFLLETLKLKKNKIEYIPGSGVDIKKFNNTPFPKSKPVITLASRLLIEKGIWEYLDVAEYFNKKKHKITFNLVGDIDISNPSSLSKKDLMYLKKSKSINFLGFKKNIQNIFSKSHIIILPSYYGEGLPKVLIEAASCGRPIITTNIPGCKDSIIPNKTGILVEPKNFDQLKASIEKLVKDRNLCKKMGLNARLYAEKNFDIRSVVLKHLNIYRKLISAIL